MRFAFSNLNLNWNELKAYFAIVRSTFRIWWFVIRWSSSARRSTRTIRKTQTTSRIYNRQIGTICASNLHHRTQQSDGGWNSGRWNFRRRNSKMRPSPSSLCCFRGWFFRMASIFSSTSRSSVRDFAWTWIILTLRWVSVFDISLIHQFDNILDENMEEAQKRDAARQAKFWFRQDIVLEGFGLNGVHHEDGTTRYASWKFGVSLGSQTMNMLDFFFCFFFSFPETRWRRNPQRRTGIRRRESWRWAPTKLWTVPIRFQDWFHWLKSTSNRWKLTWTPNARLITTSTWSRNEQKENSWQRRHGFATSSWHILITSMTRR